MKVIIAGSRTIYDQEMLEEVIRESGFEVTEVVSGAASGVDVTGFHWAVANDVPVTRFPADWGRYKKAAGHIRNAQMAEYAEALIAVWDGRSAGTANMIKQAQKRGLKIHIHQVIA